MLEVDAFAERLRDQFHGVVQQGQGAQPQEIHFEEADFLQIAHAPLRRDDRFVVFAAITIPLADHPLERHMIGQRSVGDDHAGGVRAGVSIRAFQFASDVDQLVDLGIVVVFALQVRILLEGVVEGDSQRLGNHFRELRDARQRYIEGPADVLHGRARCQGTEGNDLGHALFAVLVTDVGDHFFTTLLAAVDVDVRRFAAAGI